MFGVVHHAVFSMVFQNEGFSHFNTKFHRATKYNMNLTTQQRARARDELLGVLSDNKNAVQYLLTLQTKLVRASKASVLENQLIDLSVDFRHFQSRINNECYGNGARRKPKLLSLLTVPIIEGLKFAPDGFRTLHFHVAIGNVPEHLKTDEFFNHVKGAWQTTRYGASDVHIRAASDSDLSYITKEILKNEGHGVDWTNVSVPVFALQPQS